jgi:hypothetical protein
VNFARSIDETPAQADVRASLERVVASVELSKSPQLVSFLRFVVEAELNGRSRQIKAYTIATDALGRDARFDPQADPIVRVEAGRLRRALKKYYANGGQNDPIVIELPRGSYVPVFRPNIAPRGAIAHLRQWQRQYTDTLRDNFRLVALIAVVATVVSLSFDFTWMALGKLFEPAAETAQRIMHPAKSAQDSTAPRTE